jgi:hypothetical protein
MAERTASRWRLPQSDAPPRRLDGFLAATGNLAAASVF